MSNPRIVITIDIDKSTDTVTGGAVHVSADGVECNVCTFFIPRQHPIQDPDARDLWDLIGEKVEAGLRNHPFRDYFGS